MENQNRFCCAADTGYAMTKTVIKPYTVAEGREDQYEADFNWYYSRQSWTQELLNSSWKKPKIIVLCCMLHNMVKEWLEEDVPAHDNPYVPHHVDLVEDPLQNILWLFFLLPMFRIWHFFSINRKRILKVFIIHYEWKKYTMIYMQWVS